MALVHLSPASICYYSRPGPAGRPSWVPLSGCLSPTALEKGTGRHILVTQGWRDQVRKNLLISSKCSISGSLRLSLNVESHKRSNCSVLSGCNSISERDRS